MSKQSEESAPPGDGSTSSCQDRLGRLLDERGTVLCLIFGASRAADAALDLARAIAASGPAFERMRVARVPDPVILGEGLRRAWVPTPELMLVLLSSEREVLERLPAAKAAHPPLVRAAFERAVLAAPERRPGAGEPPGRSKAVG